MLLLIATDIIVVRSLTKLYRNKPKKKTKKEEEKSAHAIYSNEVPIPFVGRGYVCVRMCVSAKRTTSKH